MKYKHIIWDWNGTLFDDTFLCSDIMNNLLKRRNMKEITLEDYREVFTFPVIDYYKLLGHDVSPENWEIISHEFINEYEERKLDSALYPSVTLTLDRIKDSGISQSILSAYKQKTLIEIISHFNLEKYFIKLIGLNNIYAAGKLENGKKWMSELGFNKGEVLFIGDTVHDYEVAEEIGADCILFSEGHQTITKLRECDVPIINNHEKLLEFLNI